MILPELIPDLSPRKGEGCYTTDIETTVQVKNCILEQLLMKSRLASILN